MKYQAVLDDKTLDVCREAHGREEHGDVPEGMESHCRCVKVPSKLGMCAEIVIVSGSVTDAIEDLRSGLKSHGIECDDVLIGFLRSWIEVNTVPTIKGTIFDLQKRLSKYECPWHDEMEESCTVCVELIRDEFHDWFFA